MTDKNQNTENQAPTKRTIMPYVIALLLLWSVGSVLQHAYISSDEVKTDSAVQQSLAQQSLAQQSSAPLSTKTTNGHTPKTHKKDTVAREHQEKQTEHTITIRPLEIKDNDNNIILTAKDNVTFAFGSAILDPVPQTVSDVLKLIPENTSKTQALTIIGYYQHDEKPPKGYINMGIARANAIKTWLTEKNYNPAIISLQSQRTSKLIDTADTADIAKATNTIHIVAADITIIDAPKPKNIHSLVKKANKKQTN